MAVNTTYRRRGLSALGLIQAAAGFALGGKLSRNVRITSAAVGAISGLSLMHQLYTTRNQAANDAADEEFELTDSSDANSGAIGGQKQCDDRPKLYPPARQLLAGSQPKEDGKETPDPSGHGQQSSFRMQDAIRLTTEEWEELLADGSRLEEDYEGPPVVIYSPGSPNEAWVYMQDTVI